MGFVGISVPTGGGLVAGELGGIHVEALGELAERGHARLYLVALDPGDGSRGDPGPTLSRVLMYDGPLSPFGA